MRPTTILSITLIALLIFVGCTRRHTSSSASSSENLARNVSEVTQVEPRDDSAPNFSWKDSTGKHVTFDDFRGNLTVVNFWATWCGPCKKELPDLIELSKELEPKGVKFIGISTDAGPNAMESVQSFVTEYGIPYQVVMSIDELESAFGNISGLPTTFFVDKNGKIVKTIIGQQSKARFAELIASASQ